MKIKIKDKEYNCSKRVYYHIKGLESENRSFNMEIKGHEQNEFELLKENKKQQQVLNKIKERHWKTRRNYVEDLTKLYDKLTEILEEIE